MQECRFVIRTISLFCRPPCTIFELIYNRPEAIGKHCCLTINALGSFVLYQHSNKNGNMKIDKTYVEFIRSIKRQIVQSRYAAARLANREQLLLYFRTGKMISDKIKAQKWGAKVLDQISADFQKELPRLKGFSPGNLKKIRVFAEAYSPYLAIWFNAIESNWIG